MIDSEFGSVKDVGLRLRFATPEELPSLIERYHEDPRSGVRAAINAAQKRLDKMRAEYEHTASLYAFQYEIGGSGIVVGIDEVGRGAVAGPLTVAAVVLPSDPFIIGIDDSKKLTPERRALLSAKIRQHALAIGIAHIPPEDIDACGMGASLRVAMIRALADTGVEPDAVLIDGNPMHIHPREHSVVKGDGKVAAIAAASIVAKVTRDNLMILADTDYPGYSFAASKGYASADHIEAIRTKGLTEFHRESFCSGFVAEQLPLL